MFSSAIKLFFFWRRNNFQSIVFKSVFWGGVAWLATGIFTNLMSALVAGGVIAAMSAVKYTLQNRKEYARLVGLVDGDMDKLAALQKKLSEKGFAGGLMTEMLRAELHDDDDDEDEDDVCEISEAERQENLQSTTAAIENLTELCLTGGYATAETCATAKNTLLEEYGDGEESLELEVLLEEFLPDNVLSFSTEDYVDEDDHASLVGMFSEATNGKWTVKDCHSHYDEEASRWAVSFSEQGKVKSWRFQQKNDWLSEKFLQQLINYTQARSGYIVTVLDSEEFVSAVCLPPELHTALIGKEAQQAA